MYCPSCWRPIEFDEKYSKVVSCPYCNSILEFWSGELNKVWEQSDFIDFPTQFIVWQNIEWEWKNVYVKWQMRYEYDAWFFDIFFVIIDWKEFYIKEDDWLKKILLQWRWRNSSEDIYNQEVWYNYSIFWMDIFVQEIWIYKLVNIKWSISMSLIPWKEYQYLDWFSNWKMVYLEKEVWKDRIRVIEEA